MTTSLLALLLFLLFAELTQWCIHVGYHAYVKYRDRSVLTCKTINFKTLAIACVMVFFLSIIMFVWASFNTLNGSHHTFHCLILTIFIYVSHIHLLAILGRCSELSTRNYPPISRMVNKYIVSRFTGVK